MTEKTGVRAHKVFLSSLMTEMGKLGEKFESGNIQDFERERLDILGQEIRTRRQELSGF